jgi:hypothetical protein
MVSTYRLIETAAASEGRSLRRPGFRPNVCRRYGRPSKRTLKDAQFLAEADRLGLEVQHGGGDAIDRLLERLYATPETVIERVKAIAE